jgi:hypothetical protein
MDALDPSKPAMNRQVADTIASDTSEYNLRTFVVDYLIGKFNALPGVRRDVIIATRVTIDALWVAHWRTALIFGALHVQALELTLYLMQFGNDQIIGDLRQQQWQLERLIKFQSSRGDTEDLAADINRLAENVSMILYAMRSWCLDGVCAACDHFERRFRSTNTPAEEQGR